jgi:hypothetical protein
MIGASTRAHNSVAKCLPRDWRQIRCNVHVSRYSLLISHVRDVGNVLIVLFGREFSFEH